MSKINILALDDQQIILEGLRTSLSDKFYVETVNDTSGVKYALQNGKVDFLIVDFLLREVNTTALIRWVNTNHPSVPIIVLTAHIDKALIMHLQGLTVSGILDKLEPAAKLPHCIEEVLNGRRVYSSAVAEAALDALAEVQHTKHAVLDRTKLLESLSDLERKVLASLSKGSPTTEIAVALGVTVRSVEHYRRSLRSKLRVKNNIQLVLAAYELGVEEPT